MPIYLTSISLINLNIFHYISETLDLGDPTYVCGSCQAQLWYDERAHKCIRANPPEFSLCCLKGTVKLPLLDRPPYLLSALLSGEDSRSSNYKENIRAYNSMFAFTSLGGKIENVYNEGGGPPQFILSGQNFHRIGSLIPEGGCNPRFAQLYIYDTDNEISNRFHHFRFDQTLVVIIIFNTVSMLQFLHIINLVIL